jgi:hypothetical protein
VIVHHLSPAHAGAVGTLFDVANKLRDGLATATVQVTAEPNGSYTFTASGSVPAPSKT